MERYRLHPEAAVYYLTYAIVEWLPLLVSQATCTIITAPTCPILGELLRYARFGNEFQKPIPFRLPLEPMDNDHRTRA
jgi:hypothetical protein